MNTRTTATTNITPVNAMTFDAEVGKRKRLLGGLMALPPSAPKQVDGGQAWVPLAVCSDRVTYVGVLDAADADPGIFIVNAEEQWDDGKNVPTGWQLVGSLTELLAKLKRRTAVVGQAAELTERVWPGPLGYSSVLPFLGGARLLGKVSGGDPDRSELALFDAAFRPEGVPYVGRFEAYPRMLGQAGETIVVLGERRCRVVDLATYEPDGASRRRTELVAADPAADHTERTGQADLVAAADVFAYTTQRLEGRDVGDVVYVWRRAAGTWREIIRRDAGDIVLIHADAVVEFDIGVDGLTERARIAGVKPVYGGTALFTQTQDKVLTHRDGKVVAELMLTKSSRNTRVHHIAADGDRVVALMSRNTSSDTEPGTLVGWRAQPDGSFTPWFERTGVHGQMASATKRCSGLSAPGRGRSAAAASSRRASRPAAAEYRCGSARSIGG